MRQTGANDKIRQVDLRALEILLYPDPRLQVACTPVGEVDGSVRALVGRMLELMFAHRGVGLAAPQVGVAARLFVASPGFDPEDCRVFINPRIVAASGVQEGDEGCLSFPEISCKLKRSARVTIEALDLAGRTFSQEAEELAARIYQHEIDHLDGRLLVDRMGSMARLAHRRALRDLQQRFEKARTT